MKRILAMKLLVMRAFPEFSAVEVQGALESFEKGIIANLQREKDFSPEQVAALKYLNEEIDVEEQLNLITGSVPDDAADMENIAGYLHEIVAAWRTERGCAAN